MELEINESIIGAVIGPSGKSIVDIQQFSCARIQISKKGTFSRTKKNFKKEKVVFTIFAGVWK